MIHIRPHEKQEGIAIDDAQIDFVMDRDQLNELIDFLKKEELLKPEVIMIDKREDDLKIINRLLNIIEHSNMPAFNN